MNLSRRFFLCGVSCAAIVAGCGEKVDAWPRHGTAVVAGTFQGNPNTTITAIGGSMVVSNTTVSTPGFVHVSASSITCTGTRKLGDGSTVAAVPYEDLEFSWDFGNSAGTELFTRPTDGASVNANTQTGPEAVYCYRVASGTPYTITLTVRGKNGSGFTTQVFTQAITVATFAATNGTRYIDSVNGNDSWTGTLDRPNGGNTDGPWASLANFFTFQLTTGDKALYIAQGSRITSANGIRFLSNGTSNWRVGSYVGLSGIGADPIVEMNSGSNLACDLGNPTNAGLRDNFVISNIQFLAASSGTWSGNSLIGFTYSVTSTGTMSNIYFDHCTVQSNAASSNQVAILASFNGNGGTAQWMGFWGGSIVGPVYSSGSGAKHSFFGGPRTQGLSFYGVTFAGSGSSSTLDHHIYPEARFRSVYKWLTFGATGTGAYQRNYCINTNFDDFTNPVFPITSNYFCISENAFTGNGSQNTVNPIDFGNSDNNSNQNLLSNIVIEKNALANFTGSFLSPFSCAASYTYRDNRIWGNAAAGVISPGSDVSATFIPSAYRNKIYIPSGVAGGNSVFGNLGSFGSATFNTSDTNVYGSGYVSVGMAVKLTGTAPTNFDNTTVYYVRRSYAMRSVGNSAFNASNPDILAPAVSASVPLNTIVSFDPTSTLPSPFAASTNYFIVSNTGGVVRLSATRGGAALQAATAPGGASIMYCLAFTLSTSPSGSEIQAGSTGSGVGLQPQWIVQPKTVTDNVIFDARATPNVLNEVWADQITAKSLYDRNQFWKAGATNSTQFFKNNGTPQNFTQWQAASAPNFFDPNGSVAVPSPAWTTPPTQWSHMN